MLEARKKHTKILQSEIWVEKLTTILRSLEILSDLVVYV